MSAFFHKNPFFLILIPLVIGILWGYRFPPAMLQWLWGGCFLCVALLLIAFYRKWNRVFLVALLCFSFTAALISTYRSPSPFVHNSHYYIAGRCTSTGRSDNYIIKAYGQRIAVKLPNIRLLPGDSLRMTARMVQIPRTPRSYEFDYNRYLYHQNIQYRAEGVEHLEIIGHAANLFSFSQRCRNVLLQRFDSLIDDPTTAHLLKALCLGYRSEFPEETEALFRSTGTIHVLAVSGLHIGALFSLLLWLLSLFRLKSRFRELLLIPPIWFFVLISGFSPSAVRAATILSFVALGRTLGRDYSPLNIVAASAVLTLLIAPHLLFSVSFQMSYAAYIGIITINPILYHPRRGRWFVADKLFALVSVSLSAQITTLPITAFYFHNVALNSLVFNLFTVPLSTLLLYLGIAVLPFSGLLGHYLALIPATLGKSILWLLEKSRPWVWISAPLHPDPLHLILIYSIETLLIIYATNRGRKLLIAINIVAFILLLYILFTSVYLDR